MHDSFNKLFCEFNLEGKHGHRNELVFLLDEMLRREAITRDEYRRSNNQITASLNEVDGEEEDSLKDDDVEKGDEEVSIR